MTEALLCLLREKRMKKEWQSTKCGDQWEKSIWMLCLLATFKETTHNSRCAIFCGLVCVMCGLWAFGANVVPRSVLYEPSEHHDSWYHVGRCAARDYVKLWWSYHFIIVNSKTKKKGARASLLLRSDGDCDGGSSGPLKVSVTDCPLKGHAKWPLTTATTMLSRRAWPLWIFCRYKNGTGCSFNIYYPVFLNNHLPSIWSIGIVLPKNICPFML